jgi:hypothetical protein
MTMWRFTDTRASDASGHYEIMLPAWMRAIAGPVVVPTRERSPVSVASFRSIEGPPVEIEIIGVFMRREVAPADLLEVLLDRHTMIERRRTTSEEGDQLDAMTRRSGNAYVSRWHTVKDGGSHGGRVYVLEARAGERTHAERGAELSAALSSFRLLAPTPWPYFEELSSLSRREQGFVLFHPDSWQLAVVSEAPFVAHLVQAAGANVLGRMTVVSAAGVDASAALEIYDRSLRATGAELHWSATEPTPRFAGLDHAWRARAKARWAASGNSASIDVHLGIKRDRAILLALAGIDVDPLALAITTRALAIAKETLRVR